MRGGTSAQWRAVLLSLAVAAAPFFAGCGMQVGEPDESIGEASELLVEEHTGPQIDGTDDREAPDDEDGDPSPNPWVPADSADKADPSPNPWNDPKIAAASSGPGSKDKDNN